MKQQSANVFGFQKKRNVNGRVRHYLACGLTAVLSLAAAGCADGGPKPVNPKKVIPVTGIVHVDGKPQKGIKVKLAPDPMPADNKIVLPTLGKTDSEGKFELTTYYQNDGAPVGEFSLTFTYDMNPSGASRDYFRGKYSNPRTSEHKLSVKDSDESIDMGVQELTTP